MPTKYHAEHIGSFIRPPELLEARRDATTNALRLQALENTHIQRILKKQQELGFELFTDGELRRSNFMSDFTDAVEGFDLGDATARAWQAGQTQVSGVSKVAGIVTAKLRQGTSAGRPGGAPAAASHSTQSKVE